VALPKPEHLIAMKLHAVSSPHRRPGNSDWSDILDLIKIHGLSLNDETFRAMILRYGGEQLLEKLTKDLDDS
jgi:hypothetical protein